MNIKAVKKYCCEDISLIENYEKAINDTTQTWDCHHRLEIELDKSVQELIDLGLYYDRPAKELIFLTHSEHAVLHMLTGQGKRHSQIMKGKKRPNLTKALKGNEKIIKHRKKYFKTHTIVHIAKEGEKSKMIDITELQKYLEDGWHRGRK